MPPLAHSVFQAATIPFIVLGVIHAALTLYDVFEPRFFTPSDTGVRERMMGTGLGLTRRINLWQSWLGFNLSHGLGLIAFGGVFLLLPPSEAGRLLPFAIVVAFAYFALALRFWFYGPVLGTGLGVLCFVAAWLLQ